MRWGAPALLRSPYPPPSAGPAAPRVTDLATLLANPYLGAILLYLLGTAAAFVVYRMRKKKEAEAEAEI